MSMLPPRGDRSLQRLLGRLDRAAACINPVLMMIAIGLAMLNVACLIALLDSGSLTIHREDPTAVSAQHCRDGAPPVHGPRADQMGAP